MVILVSVYGTAEDKFFVLFFMKDSWNSVSVFAFFSCSPISFEVQNRCPIGLLVRVDFNIKVDQEVRTPAFYCSNLSIFLDDPS